MIKNLNGVKITSIDKGTVKMISQWVYSGMYRVYSFDSSEAVVAELLEGSYYTVWDVTGKLIGYFCYGTSAQVPAGNQIGVYDDESKLDIGLGLHPNFCGQGLGKDFLRAGLQFARAELKAHSFRLTVAAFNQRAIKVYQQVGFRKVLEFNRVIEDDRLCFWVMTL